jgi:hypothetical protein
VDNVKTVNLARFDNRRQVFQRVGLDKSLPDIARLGVVIDTNDIKPGHLIATRTAAGFAKQIQ